jgi:Xaa-Pro aminopeptidase
MNPAEFISRRQALMAQMDEGSVAVVPSAPVRARNRDVSYPFRQDSDFQYLTGFPEPESVMVLIPGRSAGEFIMFCRARDPLMETWNGRRAGIEGALDQYQADEAHAIGEIDEIMPTLLENRDRVYYAVGFNTEFDQRMMAWVNQVRARVRTGVTAPREFVSLDHLLHEMRLIKSPAEREVMRRAGRISTAAHHRAMAFVAPGKFEYQVEAELLHVFQSHGCRTAYPSIVGGGANGCILHYTENDALLRDGDLLLIDAGAELDCYASDITRTFPVNGTFSGEQRALYEVVLEAQKASIEVTRPGIGWDVPHEASVRVLTQGLVDLGLLEGEVDALIEDQQFKPFYMHRTGHWLGMDVHDVGEYKVAGEWRVLQPGIVLTVEPGLYIAAGSEGVDSRWWNMGIRIEDDVVVTEERNEILTAGVPKEIDAIEALMAESRERVG